MSILVSIVIRTLTLAAAVAAYFFVAQRVWSTKGDANIGAGLLAFALVIVVSFVWSARDGHRHGAGRAIGMWLAVAAVTPLVLLGLLAASEPLTREQLLADAAVLGPTIFGLVAGPGVLGAALGQTMGRASGAARQA